MRKYKLAICIPVYNRKVLFESCLTSAIISIMKANLLNEVEIVISDNASIDDIEKVVNIARGKYPQAHLKYSRNNVNKGLAFNFLKVVELAQSEYCWIIGADDFILEDGIHNIMKILSENDDVNFISLGYGHINLNEVDAKNIPEIIKDDSKWKIHNAPKKSYKVQKWDYLVDPQFNNVLLGSVMAGVFKKRLWDSVDKSKFNFEKEFSTLQNTYPHCYIYAKSMIGRNAWYYGYPVIVVGDGAREWSTETGNDYWSSFMPLIRMRIFDEMILEYRLDGLEKSQVDKCLSWSSKIVGLNLLPYIYNKYIIRRQIKSAELISINRIFNLHKKYLIFWMSILISIPYEIYKKLRGII